MLFNVLDGMHAKDKTLWSPVTHISARHQATARTG